MRGQLRIFAFSRLKNFLMGEMFFYRVERRFANLRNVRQSVESRTTPVFYVMQLSWPPCSQ